MRTMADLHGTFRLMDRDRQMGYPLGCQRGVLTFYTMNLYTRGKQIRHVPTVKAKGDDAQRIAAFRANERLKPGAGKRGAWAIVTSAP